MTARARPEGARGSMKVLVIYDGSQDAEAALKYGMQRARTSGGQLIAFHTARRSSFHSDDEHACKAGEPLMDSFRNIKTVKQFAGSNGGIVTVGMAVAHGENRDEILAFADTLEVDLIVAPPEFETLVQKACCLTDIVCAGSVPGPVQLKRRPHSQGDSKNYPNRAGNGKDIMHD